MVKLVAGLGNPGKTYHRTRHNLGFRVIDHLNEKYKKGFKGGKGKYLYSEIEIEGEEVILLKPLTYMNQSGQAVLDSMNFFNLTPPELFVICDDINIPLGRIRIREKGSDGGHKGLGSIIYHLYTEEFPRLRLGIGPLPENRELEDFVLEKFRKDEEEPVEKMTKRGALATESSILFGLEESMNRFNQ